MRDFSSLIVSPESARAVLAAYAADGVLKIEDKLGGARHEARFACAKVDSSATVLESAITYCENSPASVFAINVTKQGSRGRAKMLVPDKMFCAFFTKAQILAGLKKFGPALKVHTNCVCLNRVGIREIVQTFGLPICAVECPFDLKDIPAAKNSRRVATPYAAFWENWISQELHGHNVANLNNGRYDMRLVFVD